MDERKPSIEKCIESLHLLVKEDVLLAIIDVFTFIDKQENKEVWICKKSKNTKHKLLQTFSECWEPWISLFPDPRSYRCMLTTLGF